MPKEVEVIRLNNGLYIVCTYNPAKDCYTKHFDGNREEVHSWLGQNGYKATNETPLHGSYRREGLGIAS